MQSRRVPTRSTNPVEFSMHSFIIIEAGIYDGNHSDDIFSDLNIPECSNLGAKHYEQSTKQ